MIYIPPEAQESAVLSNGYFNLIVEWAKRHLNENPCHLCPNYPVPMTYKIHCYLVEAHPFNHIPSWYKFPLSKQFMISCEGCGHVMYIDIDIIGIDTKLGREIDEEQKQKGKAPPKDPRSEDFIYD